MEEKENKTTEIYEENFGQLEEKEGVKEKVKKELEEGIEIAKKTTKKIKESIISSIEDETNYHIYAALGYIPLIGWIIPKIKRKNELCNFHARESLKLSFSYLIFMMFSWFIGNAPIISWLFPDFFINSLYFVGSIIYIVSLIIGGIFAYKKERKAVPYISDIIEKVMKSMSNR
jgi:uncharacterized membrane protein